MIYKGAATLYGTGASGTFAINGAAAIGSLSPQRHTLEHRFAVGELKGADGTVKGLYVPEDFTDIEITFIPIAGGTAGAGAIAAAIAALTIPTAISYITLASFDIAAMNGNYAYMGSSDESSNEAPVQWRIKLTKFNNLTNAITVTIS